MHIREKYNYIILQEGSIGLKPTGLIEPLIEHYCTTTLIWPENSKPQRANTILTDPCFSKAGYKNAKNILDELNISFNEIGNIFISHNHYDHLPDKKMCDQFDWFDKKFVISKNIGVFPCPGHSKKSKYLNFISNTDQKVCVTGDAILDKEWLKAWKYYWPNCYGKQDIIQTWISVSKIISNADEIIPGHGKPFEVTPDLVEYLIDNFNRAQYFSECKNVINILKKRLNEII